VSARALCLFRVRTVGGQCAGRDTEVRRIDNRAGEHSFSGRHLANGGQLVERFREPAVYGSQEALRFRIVPEGEEVRFAEDSPLEGEGFEPSVPPERNHASRDCPV
jgi:hypothetical protein